MKKIVKYLNGSWPLIILAPLLMVLEVLMRSDAADADVRYYRYRRGQRRDEPGLGHRGQDVGGCAAGHCRRRWLHHAFGQGKL